jgi:hypothetical protein
MVFSTAQQNSLTMSLALDSSPRPAYSTSRRANDPQPRAGDGNRTHVACLEGRYSTIELHPRERGIPVIRNGKRRKDGFRPLPGCVDSVTKRLEISHCTSLLLYERSNRWLIRPVALTWVEQDSNLRRQCHQIYSLAPLAAWVSTRHGLLYQSVLEGNPGSAGRTTE